jgi:hypothetical protein
VSGIVQTCLEEKRLPLPLPLPLPLNTQRREAETAVAETGIPSFEEIRSKLGEYGIGGGESDWSIARSIFFRLNYSQRRGVYDSLVKRIEMRDKSYSGSAPQNYIQNYWQRPVVTRQDLNPNGGTTRKSAKQEAFDKA